MITSRLDHTREEATGWLNAVETFPNGLVAISHEPKDIMAEINKALDSLDIAMLVLAPEPLECEEVGGREIIFFPKVELRIRVIQNINLNSLPINARQARDIVMVTLQGKLPTGTGVQDPLQLARKPCQKAEFPGTLLYDVIFHYASYMFA